MARTPLLGLIEASVSQVMGFQLMIQQVYRNSERHVKSIIYSSQAAIEYEYHASHYLFVIYPKVHTKTNYNDKEHGSAFAIVSGEQNLQKPSEIRKSKWWYHSFETLAVS
jgi:hypothetical protein